MVQPTLWVYFANASFVVKAVLVILLAFSLLSWTFIIQRYWFFNHLKQAMRDFEEAFWSGKDLISLFQEVEQQPSTHGLATLFQSGFSEYVRLSKESRIDSQEIMDGVERALQIAHAREAEKLQTHLPFLASVGSISPYIGLFGTVWGIMAALQALGQIQTATIAMVAPGISEALVATAVGLFAAIPAVLAYNRFTSTVDKIEQHFDTFAQELSHILHRQALNH